ncbi:MAG: hypothetical protein WC809_16930 [Sinimarinibacterium sp.]
MSTGYGFFVEVAHEDVVFEVQVHLAGQFLTKYKTTLTQLTKTHGVQSAELDFCVWNRAPEIVAQSHSFPAALVASAGACGVGLGLSLYLAADTQPTTQAGGSS